MAKRATKWIIGLIAAAAVVVLLGAAVGVWLIVGAGGSTIEQWIGGQVVAVANGYLNPQLSFKSLDYQYPRTIVLTGVVLTEPAKKSQKPKGESPKPRVESSKSPSSTASDDSPPSTPRHSPPPPAGLANAAAASAGNQASSGPPPSGMGDAPASATPGKPVQLLTAAKITIELSQIPSFGEPIRIKKIDIERPRVNLIAPVPNQPGKLVGFSHLLKGKEHAKPVKLSDVLRIREVQLHNAQIVYDVPSTNTPPMKLDRINTVLNVKPQIGDQGEVWHRIQTTIDRAPIFNLAIDGRVNLNTLVVDLKALKLSTKLGRRYDDALPPQITELLTQHEVTGDMNLRVSGKINALAPLSSQLRTELRLRDVNAAAGDYKLPVSRMDMAMQAQNGTVDIQTLQIDTLGGSIHADGQLRYDQPDFPATFKTQVRGVKLQKALRAGETDPNAPPKMAGDISAKVTFQAPLLSALTQAQGHGQVQLRDGSLARIPVIAQLQQAISKVSSAMGSKSRADFSDTADLVFDFKGNKIALSTINVTSTIFGTKGEGDVYFNQDLDLTLQAGPLERIQDKLGPFGRIVGSIAGMVSKYRVTGTVESPKIGVMVGGGALRRVPLIGGGQGPGNGDPAQGDAAKATPKPKPPSESAPPPHDAPPPADLGHATAQ